LPKINGRYLLHSYLLGFLLCAACTYFAVKYMQAYAIVVVVLWAAFLAKPIVEAVIFFFRLARSAPLRPYQGRYYAFDNQHIRVIEVDGALWIADEDVLRIIGLVPTQAARRQDSYTQHRYLVKDKVWVYSQQAALSLVKNSGHAAAPRFVSWLENEVFAPYAKKRFRNPYPCN